jgi:hypothetical protein
MKKIKLLTLFIAFYGNLVAQKNGMTAHLGYANFLNKKASGFTIAFDYQRQMASKHFLGLGISGTMTESRGILPENLDNSNIILRDFSYLPDSIPSAFWTKESFPKFHLASKPDKYFNFSASINYNYMVWKTNKQALKIGIGAVLTFNDELELKELIRAKSFKNVFDFQSKNFQIPVFQYDTYIDLGFTPQLDYSFQLPNGVKTGVVSKLYCYPKSGRYVLAIAPFLNFQF